MPQPQNEYMLEIISDKERLEAGREQWNRLSRYTPDLYPFMCYEWFELWFKAFLCQARIHTYFLKDGNKIRAILPLIKSNSPFGSIIKFAVNDHSNKIDMISDQKDIAGYFLAFMDKLHVEPATLFYFEDVLEYSAFYSLIKDYASMMKKHYICEERHLRESVIVDVLAGWDAVNARLPKKFRRNISTARNRLQKLGKVDFVNYTNREQLTRAFESIKKISSNSWQGKNRTGIFSREDSMTLYSGLADFAARAGWLSLWVMNVNSHPVAYEYHLNLGEVDYALKAEYDTNYSKFSPGLVLDSYIVEKLSNSSVRKYDLLGKNEFYKCRWSQTTEKYVRIYLFKRNSCGMLFHFLYFPFRKALKSLPKQKIARSIIRRVITST